MMIAMLLQTGEGRDLLSLILSMMVIAIPFIYITRMSAAARQRARSAMRPEREADEGTADHEGEPLGDDRVAAERGEDEEPHRRWFTGKHPYEEIEAERKSPQQLLREALQRTQAYAPRRRGAVAEPAPPPAAPRHVPPPAQDRTAASARLQPGAESPIYLAHRAAKRRSGLARVNRLPRLQQAVIWSEILAPPKGLPESDRSRGE